MRIVTFLTANLKNLLIAFSFEYNIMIDYKYVLYLFNYNHSNKAHETCQKSADNSLNLLWKNIKFQNMTVPYF